MLNTLQITTIFLLHFLTAAEEFHYKIGDLKVFCPKPEVEWSLVGMDCFKKLDDGVTLYDWSIANSICKLPKHNASDTIHLNNFLLYKQLAKTLQQFSNSKFQQQQQRNFQMEFWTGWYIQTVDNSTVERRIQRFGTNESINIYNPIWSALEPQFSFFDVTSDKWCISWDANLFNQMRFGWRIRDCATHLPTICQTFPCFIDSNGMSQHRCADNSACISKIAICDGINDCANGEDELHCGDCNCTDDGKGVVKKHDKVYSVLFGYISPQIRDSNSIMNYIDCCLPRREEWTILQRPGARIQLNFLIMHFHKLDRMWVEDLENDGKTLVQIPVRLRTYSNMLMAHNVRIVFERWNWRNVVKTIDEEFILQYTVDETFVCNRRFESWNGTFSSPMQIQDMRLYQVPMHCRWIIENRERGIVSIKIPKFELADDDWLAILFFDNNSNVVDHFSASKTLFGNFSGTLKRKPPMAFLAIASQVHFIFTVNKHSAGERGFQVIFERSCLNQQLNSDPFGVIEIPPMETHNTNHAFICSWLIQVPCLTSQHEFDCAFFTLFLDDFNGTKDDKILLKTIGGKNVKIISADDTKLRKMPLSFRFHQSLLEIKIQKFSTMFSARITYSIDCLPPPQNVFLICRTNISNQFPALIASSFPYRFSIEFDCPNMNKNDGIGKLFCTEGGKWNFFDGKSVLGETGKSLDKEEDLGAKINGNDQTSLENAGIATKFSTCVVPIITNGSVLMLDRQNNGNLHFSCQLGFSPIKPQIAYCNMVIEQWEPEPRCSEILCPDPPNELSPSIEYQPSEQFLPAQFERTTLGNRFGSWALYKCPPGTSPRGSQLFAVCSHDAIWSGYNATCQKQQCPAFFINLGKILDRLTPINAHAKIKCVEGAEFRGTPPKCLLNKLTMEPYWNGTEESFEHGIWPGCEFTKHCDANPCGQYGKCIPLLRGSSPTATNYTCKCENGYRFNRSLPSGQQCIENNDCADGNALCASGTCIESAATNAIMLSYKCVCPDTHELYEDYMETTNLVIPSTQHLIPKHTCIRKRCPIPFNGQILFDNKFFFHSTDELHLANSRVSIYCRFYHNENASAAIVFGPAIELHCLPNGKWSDNYDEKVSTKCTRSLSCPLPKLPNRSIRIKNLRTAYLLNDVIEFECANWSMNGNRTDYLMIGANKAICLPTGQWSNEPPKCILPQCSAIDFNEIALASGLSLTFQSSKAPTAPDEPFALGASIQISCPNQNGANNVTAKWIMTCIKCANCTVPSWSMNELPNCGNENAICIIPNLIAHELVPSQNSIPIGGHVSFRCAQPNYMLNDNSPRNCVAAGRIKFGRRMKRAEVGNQQTTKTAELFGLHAKWRKQIENATPSTRVVFDSEKQRTGWVSSTHWTQSNNTGSWNYQPLLSGKNFLITPMVTVTAMDWLDVSVQLSPIPCQNCLIWLSYFSTPKSLSSTTPPLPEMFLPLGGILANPSIHSIQFSLEHHQLWIQISVDQQSPQLRMEHLQITITACPSLQLDLTLFPRTPVKSENHSIIGECVNGGIRPSALSTMHLVCSPLGKWILPTEEALFNACRCASGLRLDRNGLCTKHDGLLCYSCTSRNETNCLASPGFSDVQKCNGEDTDHEQQLCIVRTMSKGSSQIPYQVERDCATRSKCGIMQSNINARQHCETTLDGIQICIACCADDFCNNKLPNQLDHMTTTPSSPFFADMSFMPSLLVESSGLEKNMNFSLDGPLPMCIDQQAMELRCEPSLLIRRIGAHFTEPILIPWPRVVDNDPHFQLRPLDHYLQLIHPIEPVSFRGNEQQIFWQAQDRNGFTRICATKLEFSSPIQTSSTDVFSNSVQLQCPDVIIRHVNASDGRRWIPVEYPPINFHAPNGSSIQLSFDPPVGTSIELGRPTLITVNAVNENTGRCQFWYQTTAFDCPKWQLGGENQQFECVREDEKDTVRCERINPCPVGKEYPKNLRALYCRIGTDFADWTYVVGGEQGDSRERLIGEPMCQEERSSTITLSIHMLPIGPPPTANCLRRLAQRIRPHLTHFLHVNCPVVQWDVQGQTVNSNSFVQNYTTAMHNTTRDVLLCIQLLTNQIDQALPDALNPPLNEGECPFGPYTARRQTIAYHLNCPAGWAPNERLRCEICPKGYFSSSINETCVPCPLGTFAATPGTDRECQKCPLGYFTERNGASTDADCLPFCPPGFYSSSGLAPCHPCPVNSFQPQKAQNACIHCSDGLITMATATSSAEGCKALCKPGNFISSFKTAKQQCRPCPRGFFNPNANSPTCEPCPHGMTTKQSEGAINLADCIIIGDIFGACFTNNNCSGHGQCKSGRCVCDLGFVGSECAFPLDLCAAEFCLNGGICHFDATNGSTCVCATGFNGTRCEIENLHSEKQQMINAGPDKIVNVGTLNDVSNKCLLPTIINKCPNGQCKNGICECNVGFAKMDGTNGEGDNDGMCLPSFVDVCASQLLNPCQPHSECNTLMEGQFRCVCKDGWQGTFCEQPPNSCFTQSHVCLNGGTCAWSIMNEGTNSGISSKCICPSKSRGERCEFTAKSQLDKCEAENWCGTNGHCKLAVDSEKDGKTGGDEKLVYCKCAKGYFGEFCEAFLNPCSSNFGITNNSNVFMHCLNGGICQLDEQNQPFCKCPLEWMGEHCEQLIVLDVNGCHDHDKHCMNGGTCAENGHCLCPLGFIGSHCQLKWSPCNVIQQENEEAVMLNNLKNVCGEHGNCTGKTLSDLMQIKCNCENGWTGPFCMFSSNACEHHQQLHTDAPCQNGGTCIPIVGSNNTYQCACPDGFTGLKCEKLVDYCSLPQICMNNGKCHRNNGVTKPHYECECNEDYIGKNCEQPITRVAISSLLGLSVKRNRTTPIEQNPCLQNVNYCNAGGNCHLVPNTRIPYCECEPEFIGQNCDAKKPSHYNIYFAGPEAAQTSLLVQQIRSSEFSCNEILDEFTLCLWVQLGKIRIHHHEILKNDTGEKWRQKTFAAIKRLEQESTSISHTLFELHSFGVQIYGGASKQPGIMMPYQNESNKSTAKRQPLAEYAWHHLCLVASSASSHMQLYLNGQLSNELNGFAWNNNDTYARCSIMLGEKNEGNGENADFIGQISQTMLYTKHLEAEAIEFIYHECHNRNAPIETKQQFKITVPSAYIHWATNFTTVSMLYNSAQFVLFPGICAAGTLTITNQTMNIGGIAIMANNYAKIPPKRIGCPDSQHIVVSEPGKRSVPVFWNDSLHHMFRQNGQIPIVRFESNFRTGQTFGWGHHHIVYLAEDAAGNWATCEFDIVVAPLNCTPPSVSEHTRLTLQTIDWHEEGPHTATMHANLHCANPQFVFNTRPPLFYTCDRFGQWNQWDNFGVPFTVPSCTETENAIQEVQGDLQFHGNCSDTDNYIENVINCIANASARSGGFCDEEKCTGQLSTQSTCLLVPRKERQPFDPFFVMQFTFDNKNNGADNLMLIHGKIKNAEKSKRSVEEEQRQDIPEQLHIVRIQFDLNVNNTKHAIASVISDSMEEFFGTDFKGQQSRLSCSNVFPQLHVDNMSDDIPLVQCATCAPGETWQSDERQIATITKTESIVNANASGNCVKCPPDTYKPKSGVHACIPCPDGRITGGVTGCMRVTDCYINCEPGSVYNWELNKCIPCARGQFMPYRGRLKCMACPRGRSTGLEGSTSAEQCALRCGGGEEIGPNERCIPCTQGSFSNEKMEACKKCDLGFTTHSDGASSASECNVVFCPPGFMQAPINGTIAASTTASMIGIARRQMELETSQLNMSSFTSVCLPCPIGFYQNEYGFDRCIRCPAGFVTVYLGARSILECDQRWDGSCKPDEVEPCPNGMECVQIRAAIFECHQIPEEQQGQETSNGLRRLWFPIILGLCSVFALTIMLLTFLKNRKKWILAFHRHFPTASVLCCKKMTVDNLSSNNFARADIRSPVATTNNHANIVVIVDEIANVVAEESTENDADADINSNRNLKSAVVLNIMDTNDGENEAGEEHILMPKLERGGRTQYADSSLPSSQPGSSLERNPLEEIRTGLMEVLNVDDDEPVGENGDNDDAQHQFTPMRIQNRLALRLPPPKLTVQTSFPSSANDGSYNGSKKINERIRHHSDSITSASSSSHSSLFTPISMRRNEGDTDADKQLKKPGWYYGERLQASALATDAIGRRVIFDNQSDDNVESDIGLRGLRRIGAGGAFKHPTLLANSAVDRVPSINSQRSSQGQHSLQRSTPPPAVALMPGNPVDMGRRRHYSPIIELRRHQLNEQSQQQWNANSNSQPFPSALRSFPIKRRIAETNITTATSTKEPPAPSYDDDDDAFFS